MKILHVVHSLTRGGLENGLVNLVNLLPTDEFEHAICCLDASGEMADRITRSIEIFELHRKPHDAKLPFRLAKVIRHWRPDIIHCRNWNSWFDTVIAHFMARTPATLVWSFHGFAAGDYFPFRRKIISRMLSLYTAELFAVCKDSAQRYAFKTSIPARRFATLYNGVNTLKFQPKPQERQRLRIQLNIPLDKVVILTVASLTPIKNHTALIDSIKILINMYHQSPMVLFLGDGSLRSTLQDKIATQGLNDFIKILGNRDNIPDYLAAADIFVLPSRLEGMSNAILEAMATGLPIVANNCGGNREIITPKETGYLCELDNPKEIADALNQLIGNKGLRETMGRNARIKAEQVFSIDAMIANYRRYYLDVYNKYSKNA
jgi:sugar transferase (PEP-CTERM/EpsH1 system associated)